MSGGPPSPGLRIRCHEWSWKEKTSDGHWCLCLACYPNHHRRDGPAALCPPPSGQSESRCGRPDARPCDGYRAHGKYHLFRPGLAPSFSTLLYGTPLMSGDVGGRGRVGVDPGDRWFEGPFRTVLDTWGDRPPSEELSLYSLDKTRVTVTYGPVLPGPTTCPPTAPVPGTHPYSVVVGSPSDPVSGNSYTRSKTVDGVWH